VQVRSQGDGKHRVPSVSEANQFRQYAEEALGWVSQSRTEEEKRTLTDLACMWAQAALQSERIFGVEESPGQRLVPYRARAIRS
jgi:hypothetical protein